MQTEEIDALIRATIEIAELEIRSDDGVHFTALVVSPEFEGLRQIQRHQLVYKALGERMGREIHAMSIRALTPAERHGAGG
jgi:acid stress-induced BolA-like protein IbaG/YrbA